MLFFPYFQQTLVSTQSKEEVKEEIGKHIRPTDGRSLRELRAESTFLVRRPSENYLYEGQLLKEGFLLHPFSLYPEHFQPQIRGNIESTSRGSLIFIRYQFKPGTLFFFYLTSFIFIATASVFVFLKRDWWGFGLATIAYGGAYSVALLSFRQKLNHSRQQLEKLLS